jgi:hypothetical protein
MPRIRTFAALTVLLPGALASVCWGAGALTGSLSPSDLALIDRVTWGVNTTVAAQYMATGRDRWLDAQLHPAPGDRLPPAAQAIVAAMPDSRAIHTCNRHNRTVASVTVPFPSFPA